jgi:hypothetical protein
MNKTLLFLKKILIAYCVLIFLIETVKFFGTENLFYFKGYCKQIIVYFILIAILIVQKKWMWFIGLLYFIVGTIDLLFLDISSGIPRFILSGHSKFDYSYLISWAYQEIRIYYGFEVNLILNNIGIFLSIIEKLLFPITIILFFTNPVRRFYGLNTIWHQRKTI